jgi:Zn-dependent protease with chaperone function
MPHQMFFALQIALAWFFALSAGAALLFVAARPFLLGWIRQRAWFAAIAPLAVRLLPAGVSIGIVLALVLPAFAWLEPAGSAARGERLGLTGLLLALGGGAVLAASLTRGLAAVLSTRRRMKILHGGAARTSPAGHAPLFVSDSPVASVVLDGLLRPRVFVSRSVVDRLSAEELDRAIAHELAHHRAHDNIKRRLLAFAPDLVSHSRLARTLEEAWKHAAELEADAAACRGGDSEAVTLASALLKVVRLNGGRRQLDLGRAAFHDDAPVADRILRLCTRIGRETPAPRRGAALAAAALTLVAWAILVTLPILPAVHRVTEMLVHLP